MLSSCWQYRPSLRCLFVVLTLSGMYVSCSPSIQGRLLAPRQNNVTPVVQPADVAPKNVASHSDATEWTVLIYMQAKNNLDSFAHKNLTDIAATGSNKKLNVLVQWFQPGKQGVWRYRVEQGKVVLDSSFPSDTDGNKAKDLVDAARWAVKKYPSKKFALVLWNHGVGILDPAWGNTRPPWQGSTPFAINQSFVKDNPRIAIEGLTTRELTLAHQMLDEHDDILKMWDHEDWKERGILFNEQSKTYMDNQNLTQALSEIKSSVLGNHKINVLGFDACLMAMAEVGHLARKYAEYMVASQEVELANGWDYFSLCKELSEKTVAPAQMSQLVVKSYENYYKNKIQFYTQSAIDLSKMDDVKRSLDTMASSVKACQDGDKSFMTDCIKKARRSCLQFSAHSYIDLYSFCKEVTHFIDTRKNKSKVVSEVRKQLANVMKAAEAAVIANTAGKNLSDARELSIYFPLNHIDSSYLRTEFAQESGWLHLIKSNMH